jgi:hypothetical protein
MGATILLRASHLSIELFRKTATEAPDWAAWVPKAK